MDNREQMAQLARKAQAGSQEAFNDVLSPDAAFAVDEGFGFTTEIVYASGTGVMPFKLACSLNGVPLRNLPGVITVKLPVPAAQLADIGQLEVDHRAVRYPAAPEGSYLVFQTNII